MTVFDRLMIAPARHDLVTALLRAAELANDGWRLLSVDPSDWVSAVVEIAAEPQGARRWRAQRWTHTADLVLAWWTDHRGKRHFRVQGSVLSSFAAFAPKPPSRDPRAPLWYVYPEHTFFRQPAGAGERE